MATKPEAEKTPWEILSAVDLADKIEKKNGMSYVSWAWAWGVLKKNFPYAWYRKHETSAGYPCFHDVQGYAFVKVTVGLDRTGDHEVTETFPVLDHRNKPIQGPNPFDINTALQRCLTKAIAYHGLGHYIYAGEDIPQETSGTPPQSAGEVRTAPSVAQAVPTPTQQGNVRPAAPPGMVDPIEVYDHAGTAHWIEKNPKTMSTCLLGYILFCQDDVVLTRLFSANRHVRDAIAAMDADTHTHLINAFKDAKARLTQTNETKTTGA